MRAKDHQDVAVMRERLGRKRGSMPVWKFRSIEEMNNAPSPPATLEARLRAVWSLATALVPPLGPRGVEKFRSVDEADRARIERERRRAAELRRTRGESDPRA